MNIVKGIIYFLASILIPIIILFGIFIVGLKSISPKTGDPSEYLILMAMVIWASTFFLGSFYFKMKVMEPIEAYGILAGFIFWLIISLLALFTMLTV